MRFQFSVEEEFAWEPYGSMMVSSAKAKLDLAILEVGLGGRLDTVNIVDADCAVITSIDLDHMEFLGHDREAIGREKAGILRPVRPAIVSDPLPPASVQQEAERVGAELWLLGRDFNFAGDKQQWSWAGRGRRYAGLVEGFLVGRILAQQQVADRTVDVGDGFQHALAQVTALVAITQLQRFARASGSTGRRAGAADDAVVEKHVRFDSGVATGVENFTTFDVDDFCHCCEHSKVDENDAARGNLLPSAGTEQRASSPTITPGPRARAFIERYFTGESRVTRFLSSENP